MPLAPNVLPQNHHLIKGGTILEKHESTESQATGKKSRREDMSTTYRLISFPPRYLNWAPGGPPKCRKLDTLHFMQVYQVSALRCSSNKSIISPKLKPN